MQDVEATMLKVWLERGEARLIDVREPSEYAVEHIPDARLLPLSTFDPARVPQEAGKKVVLHCVMGMRSAQAGQKLLDAGFTTVYNFRGGVQAWKDAGYTTIGGQRAPLSLQRQVLAEPFIEHSEAAANDSLRCSSSTGPRRPCKRETRTEIQIVADVRLVLISKTKAQRQPLVHTPIVSCE